MIIMIIMIIIIKPLVWYITCRWTVWALLKSEYEYNPSQTYAHAGHWNFDVKSFDYNNNPGYQVDQATFIIDVLGGYSSHLKRNIAKLGYKSDEIDRILMKLQKIVLSEAGYTINKFKMKVISWVGCDELLCCDFAVNFNLRRRHSLQRAVSCCILKCFQISRWIIIIIIIIIILERENWSSFCHYFERFNVFLRHLRHTISQDINRSKYILL